MATRPSAMAVHVSGVRPVVPLWFSRPFSRLAPLLIALAISTRYQGANAQPPRTGWYMLARQNNLDSDVLRPWTHGVSDLNTDNVDAREYSILSQRANYVNPGDGRYEFALYWPQLSARSCGKGFVLQCSQS